MDNKRIHIFDLSEPQLREYGYLRVEEDYYEALVLPPGMKEKIASHIGFELEESQDEDDETWIDVSRWKLDEFLWGFTRISVCFNLWKAFVSDDYKEELEWDCLEVVQRMWRRIFWDGLQRPR